MVNNSGKKNIAILVWAIRIGGAERVAVRLGEMLYKKGYNVYYFVSTKNDTVDYEHIGEVVVIPRLSIYGNKSFLKPYREYLYNAALISMKKKEYDIAISISIDPVYNLLNILSRQRDKVILTIHCCLSLWIDATATKDIAYKKIAVFLGNFCNRMIVVCNWSKKDLHDNYKISNNKLKVIYNAFDEPQTDVKLNRDNNIVAIVAGLRTIKQQWHIIRAFSKVVKNVEDAKLYIAGTGIEEKYLKDLVSKLNMEDYVIFAGFCANVSEVFEKSKLLVMSSQSEAFPCTIVEAFAHGVPVIATDSPGGIYDVVSGNEKTIVDKKGYRIAKCGVLTENVSGNRYSAETPLEEAENQIADAIIMLLMDERLRLTMAQNAYNESKQYSKEKIDEAWNEVIGITQTDGRQ